MRIRFFLCIFFVSAYGGLFGQPVMTIQFKSMVIGLGERVSKEQSYDGSEVVFYYSSNGCTLHPAYHSLSSIDEGSHKDVHQKYAKRLYERMQAPNYEYKAMSWGPQARSVLHTKLVEEGEDMISVQHLYTLLDSAGYYSIVLNVIRGSERACDRLVERIDINL